MSNVIAVIITYNIGNRLNKSIELLKRQVKDIIIVDNGSDFRTIEILKNMENEINLIFLNENKGISYALNRGIEKAIEIGCDWIITLDHDSIVEENMIDKMLQAYKDYTDKDRVGMITPVHIEEKEKNIYNGSGTQETQEILTEITSGSMVKADIYKNVIRYDEKLFIDLVDHDFCLRLNNKGYTILKVKSAILWHNLGDSRTKKIFGIKLTYTNHNEIRRYYMTRNRFYVWNKYKNEFPKWVKKDKNRFIRETMKVLLFEEDKLKKVIFTIKGYKDYKEKNYGRLIVK